MTVDELAQAVSEAKVLWQELGRRWSDLHLPGSPYTPSDFLCALALSRFSGTPEQISARVQQGHARLAALQDRGVINRFSGDSERIAVCLLGLLQDPVGLTADAMPIESTTPLPEPESAAPLSVVSQSVDASVAAHIAPEIIPPSPPHPPIVPSEAFQSVQDQACPVCGHRVDCCRAGHYGTTSAEHIQRSNEESRGCAHVAEDGNCAICTDEDTAECAGSNCDRLVVVSRGVKCRDYESCDDCAMIFCDDDCADGELNELGYCQDCATITCDGCQEEFDNGLQRVCANLDCKKQKEFCGECGLRLLNAANLCAKCAREDIWTCNECANDFVSSRMRLCDVEDCETSYCEEHAANNLDDKGRCGDCATT